MARTKGEQNKSAFIRDLPRSLSAAEVVAKGKAKGMSFSEAYVHAVRAAAKKKGSVKSSAKAAAADDGSKVSRMRAVLKKGKVKRGRPATVVSGGEPDTATASTKEAQLKTLVAAIGLDRSRAIFSAVESAFAE